MVTPPYEPFDAAHWRHRAEEARAVAEMMLGHSGRDEMLKIAHAYDHMAERAEAHAEALAVIPGRDKKTAA